ncbi:MAG: PEP-CTERM sorting domain-containing protein, partial [Microcystis sp.]
VSNALGAVFPPYGVLTGVITALDSDWISKSYVPSSVEQRFYGMSSVLTVPTATPPAATVPEPTSVLGYITLGGLMLGGAVRKARK